VPRLSCNSQFFFAVTGFLINPVASYQSITTNFPLASTVIGALARGDVSSIRYSKYRRQRMIDSRACSTWSSC
jgi:hypothetical protein